MSADCFYLPVPPRAWTRYDTRCPDAESLMRQKGNVLQYKANSASLTSNQRYAQIARGKWSKKNVWATAGVEYTNPNTSLMRRTNTSNVAINPKSGEILGPTLLPVTCPIAPNFPIYPALPTTADPMTAGDDLPAPDPVPSDANDIPSVPPLPTEEPVVIPDGGTLICGTYDNACTGESSQQRTGQRCYLSTDSDVPGPIVELCWNDGSQSWYPREKRMMDPSTSKWPVNATLVSAIHFYPPK